jgi:tetratricopeptide (TPR) repeat protein
VGLVYSRMGDNGKAAEALDKSLAIDPKNRKAWTDLATLMEKEGRDDDAVRAYDNAIGLDATDAFAWNGKGIVLLRMGRHDQAARAFERALELNPAMESAQEGKRITDERLHLQEISANAVKVLETEYRLGRDISKEDAFRQVQVPYAALDEVFEFLERKEVVDVGSLQPAEFEEYEEASRRVLVTAYRNPTIVAHGLKLQDVLMNLPDSDITAAKKVLAYIVRVNEMDFKSLPPDPELEKTLRQVLSLPEERRTAIGIMENMQVGIFTARRLMGMLASFRGPGYRSPKVKVKDMHWEEAQVPVPEEEPEAPEATAKQEQAPPPKAKPLFKEPSPYEDPMRYTRQAMRQHEKRREEQEQEAEDFRGRRCLFHGGLAIKTCPSCSSLLCSDCLATGVCPRCKTPLDGARPRKAERKQREPEEIAEEDEKEESPVEEGGEKTEEQQRDFSRL